jgi:outer membrane protein assembly factor BamB
VAAGVAATLSGCWLQPGYDAARSRNNAGETTLTSATVGGLTEKWDTAVAPFVNEPVSSDGGIFVTAGEATVARLDPATGATAWTTTIVDSDPAPFLDDPAFVDGEVVVPAALGRFGEIYHVAPTTGVATPNGIGSSPHADVANAGGEIATRVSAIIPGSSNVAVNQVRWTYTAGTFGTMAAADYAIIGEKILWSQGTNALGFSPACPDQTPPTPTTIGCAPDWSTPLGGTVVGGPARVGDDGIAYVDSSGRLSVIDSDEGGVRWATELGVPAAAAPAVAGGNILVVTTDGQLWAFPAGGCGDVTCFPLWTAPTSAAPSVAPTVGGDVVYVGTAGGEIDAFALDGCGAETCAALTTVDAGSEITGGPIVDDGRVFAGTADGRVVAFGL